ncbi:hypothetical protein IX38_14245 [Chryseobacterium luteum]|uniref:Pirin N-terminal domain-containing protein n=1 Tax=Chryseobacterium luteum TaxID=421531 RepID=A0A085ZCC8_9FLAO|nr:hypothetical protein IX38_14245 [Chryseobacterium luteum]
MIQLLKKEDQFNRTIFNGNFIANKPAASGTKDNVKPYSSLFYWSHARAIDQCEFGLHPHEGFEIMTLFRRKCSTLRHDGSVTDKISFILSKLKRLSQKYLLSRTPV